MTEYRPKNGWTKWRKSNEIKQGIFMFAGIAILVAAYCLMGCIELGI